MSNIAFRLEANEYVGLGHLYRCLTLANELTKLGWTPTFFISEVSRGSLGRIQAHNIQCVVVPELDQVGDAHWMKGWMDQDEVGFQYVVVDHYGLDKTWEALIDSDERTLMVMDDLANRHHQCDFLVDMSLDRSGLDYEKWIVKHTKLLLGTEYCLLRPEFLQNQKMAKALRRQTQMMKSVLVSFGATDPRNLTSKTLDALEDLEFNGDIHVLTTSQNPYLETLLYREGGNVQVHVDIKNVADILIEVDVCVGALGGSTWERACLGLPSLCVQVAENQALNAHSLAATGCVNVVEEGALLEALRTMLNEDFMPAWHGMSESAFNICDGMGVHRILHQVFEVEPQVELLAMTDADMESLYLWQTEDGNRAYSREPKAPAWEEHKVWYTRSLGIDSRRMWKIQFLGVDCGYVRLDDMGQDEEVSVLLSKKYRRLGLAKAALNQLKIKAKTACVLAHVHPENIASGNLFAKAGFQKVSADTYRWEAS